LRVGPNFEQICVQLPTSAVSVTLLAVVAERRAIAAVRRALSIDISRRHGAQQQTRRSRVRWANYGTGRQTERRTPDRFIDSAE